MFDDRAEARSGLGKSFIYTGFHVPEPRTHHAWTPRNFSMPWAHLCRVQCVETIVLQGSKKPFNASRIPAPSNNEVPSSVIIIEILPEARERQRIKRNLGLNQKFKKETLSLTLLDLNPQIVSRRPFPCVLADKTMVGSGTLGLRSQLCYLPAAWPWTCPLPSLRLSFLLRKLVPQ